ncbi:MAG: 2-phospho-L-lactate transferase [Thaumarchaeota archaeon]|nr:2-phospho-L-lactate transferase [Nitrososphaerota archaeon]
MKVVALAGGTGSAKVLRGMKSLPIDLTVVANVGDNVWMYGAYVCPDVDIACYTLSGVVDRARGWGVEGETFEAMGTFERSGLETWFRLGDRDLAVCMARTEMLRRGSTLTEATDMVRRGLGVPFPVLPATDRHVETRVATPGGDLHLQEFWVRDRGRPRVTGVSYRGASSARPTRAVADAILRADRVVLCPANPVTSIGPMLAVPGFARLLARTDARAVALSPMSGSGPISGPAGKFMKAVGRRADSVGVAKMYSQFLDAMMISAEDSAMSRRVADLGVECRTSDTMIRGPQDEARLAKELLAL